MVAGHHGAGAVQGLPATGALRRHGGDRADATGRRAFLRLLQRRLPHQALVRVRELGRRRAEEGPQAAAVGVAGAGTPLAEQLLGGEAEAGGAAEGDSRSGGRAVDVHGRSEVSTKRGGDAQGKARVRGKHELGLLAGVGAVHCVDPRGAEKEPWLKRFEAVSSKE